MKNTPHVPFGTNIRMPNLRKYAAISALLMVFLCSGFSTAQAQNNCEPCAIGRFATMSAPSTRLRPTCDAVSFGVTVDNPDDCNKTVQVDIFFISPDESLDLPDIFNDMLYTGSIPIFSDVIIAFNSNAFARVVSYRVNVPAGNTAPITFPFSVSAIGKTTPSSSWVVQVFASSLDETGALCSDFRTHDALAGQFTLDWESPYKIAKGNSSISQLIADQVINASGCLNLVMVPDQSGALPELTVDQTYVFGLNSSRSNILLASGSKININGMGNLSMINCDMFTCSTLARGIEVQTSGTLRTVSTTLNDSRFAIDAKPGSTLSINSTGFFDNYIGLNLDMTSAPEISKRVNILAFSGNTFSTAQAAINAPYAGMTEALEARGFCGIRLRDYRDFNVFGGNTFTKLANGIVVFKSLLNIGNMTFDDMNSVGAKAYPLEGFGVFLSGKGNRPYWAHINELWTNMTFNNCKTGVRADHYAALVGNTRMSNVDEGIVWYNSYTSEIRLRKNIISSRKYGIRAANNEPFFTNSQIDDNTIAITTAGGGLTPVTGIEIEEDGAYAGLSPIGWSVARNTVTMNLGGRGILYRAGIGGAIDGNSVLNMAQPNNYTGIYTEGSMNANIARNTISQSGAAGLGTSQGIYSSGGTSNTFQCNCLDNTNVGAQFYDLADFTNSVRGNNFNTHVTGLQIGNQGVNGAYIGRQNHTGNLWDLTQIPAGEFGGINWTSDPFKSRFEVNGAMGTTNEHPAVDPPSQWFFQTAAGSFACSSACVFPPPMGTPPRVPETDIPTELDLVTVRGQLSTNPDIIWKGNYRLYRKILRHPAMENDPMYAAFKAAHANQSTGKMAVIAEDRAKLFTLSPADQATDLNYRNTIGQQSASLRTLDSLLQSGAPFSAVQYNALILQKSTNETNYTTFLQNKAVVRQQMIQNALALNAGASTNQTCATNHKLVNGIVLNMLLQDEIDPTPNDLAVLTAIAGQCPVSGGDAVYEARAIVERITGQTFDDALLCATGNRSTRERGETAETTPGGSVSFFPNPTTGLLMWEGTAGQLVTIRVFDQLGVLVNEQKTEAPQADLSLLHNGLYFVQMVGSDGALLAAEKVFLLKD